MTTGDDEWMESSDVLSLFPTLVWKVHLGPVLHRLVNAKIHDVLEGARRGSPPLQPGEAWQSAQNLHEAVELAELVTCIRHATLGIPRFSRIGYERFEITACWANISAPGASLRIHSHPNNFLSSVYYARIRPGGDTINFHEPRNQTAIIRPPVIELTRENTDQVVVEVKDGTLLVFPSFLQHSVDPNRGVENRITVSFNIMFSAFTEKLSKPLW